MLQSGEPLASPVPYSVKDALNTLELDGEAAADDAVVAGETVELLARVAVVVLAEAAALVEP